MSLILDGTNGLSDVDGTAAAPAIRGTDANTGIFFPAADTIAFAEGGVEAARFDASGNLIVGASSSTYSAANRVCIEVNGATDSVLAVRTGGTARAYIQATSTQVNLYTASAIPLTLGTDNNERARITSGGYFKASNDGTYIGGGSAYHEFRNTANASTLILSATNASLSDDLFAIYASRNTTNNSFFAISYYNSGAAAYKFRVADSGNVTNTNNSYGSISDIKLKENVTDATPKLDKLNQVRVVNYNLIGDEKKQLGVIAQELEQVFPSMVEEMPDKDEEGNDLGTTTKSVKYSVFVPMLIKAIQEQQALITALTTRITALEAA